MNDEHNVESLVTANTFRWLFVVSLLVTTIACLLPGDHINPNVGQFDKWLHGLAWCAIAFCSTSALALHARARWLAIALFSWSFGVELAQHFVPMRAFEWADLLANGGGVLVGISLARSLRRLPLITGK